MSNFLGEKRDSTCIRLSFRRSRPVYYATVWRGCTRNCTCCCKAEPRRQTTTQTTPSTWTFSWNAKRSVLSCFVICIPKSQNPVKAILSSETYRKTMKENFWWLDFVFLLNLLNNMEVKLNLLSQLYKADNIPVIIYHWEGSNTI